MLTKVNNEMDESKNNINNCSLTDLPSELTMTEDNRMPINNGDLRFNMATFEASKKLLKENNYTSTPIQNFTEESLLMLQAEQNSLLRKLEIFEGNGQAIRLLHTVVCTGFNAAAPRLIYSNEKEQNKAVIDKGNNDVENLSE